MYWRYYDCSKMRMKGFGFDSDFGWVGGDVKDTAAVIDPVPSN